MIKLIKAILNKKEIIQFDVNNYYKDYVLSLNKQKLKSLRGLLTSQNVLDKKYVFNQLKQIADEYNILVVEKFLEILQSKITITDIVRENSIYFNIDDKYLKLEFKLNGVNLIKCKNNPKRVRLSDHNAKKFKDDEDQFIIHQFIPNTNKLKDIVEEEFNKLMR